MYPVWPSGLILKYTHAAGAFVEPSSVSVKSTFIVPSSRSSCGRTFIVWYIFIPEATAGYLASCFSLSPSDTHLPLAGANGYGVDVTSRKSGVSSADFTEMLSNTMGLSCPLQ